MIRRKSHRLSPGSQNGSTLSSRQSYGSATVDSSFNDLLLEETSYSIADNFNDSSGDISRQSFDTRPKDKPSKSVSKLGNSKMGGNSNGMRDLQEPSWISVEPERQSRKPNSLSLRQEARNGIKKGDRRHKHKQNSNSIRRHAMKSNAKRGDKMSHEDRKDTKTSPPRKHHQAGEPNILFADQPAFISPKKSDLIATEAAHSQQKFFVPDQISDEDRRAKARTGFMYSTFSSRNKGQDGFMQGKPPGTLPPIDLSEYSDSMDMAAPVTKESIVEVQPVEDTAVEVVHNDVEEEEIEKIDSAVMTESVVENEKPVNPELPVVQPKLYTAAHEEVVHTESHRQDDRRNFHSIEKEVRNLRRKVKHDEIQHMKTDPLGMNARQAPDGFVSAADVAGVWSARDAALARVSVLEEELARVKKMASDKQAKTELSQKSADESFQRLQSTLHLIEGKVAQRASHARHFIADHGGLLRQLEKVLIHMITGSTVPGSSRAAAATLATPSNVKNIVSLIGQAFHRLHESVLELHATFTPSDVLRTPRSDSRTDSPQPSKHTYFESLVLENRSLRSQLMAAETALQKEQGRSEKLRTDNHTLSHYARKRDKMKARMNGLLKRCSALSEENVKFQGALKKSEWESKQRDFEQGQMIHDERQSLALALSRAEAELSWSKGRLAQLETENLEIHYKLRSLYSSIESHSCFAATVKEKTNEVDPFYKYDPNVSEVADLLRKDETEKLEKEEGMVQKDGESVEKCSDKDVRLAQDVQKLSDDVSAMWNETATEQGQ